MAEGGSSANILRGLKRGISQQWKNFHDDQRLSWIGHFLVCLFGSAVFAFVIFLLVVLFRGDPLPLIYYHTGGSVVGFLYFMLREAGDEDYHRNVKKDWDKLDQDADEQGKAVQGVTPRFDKIGDLTGPIFHMVSFFAASIYTYFGG